MNIAGRSRSAWERAHVAWLPVALAAIAAALGRLIAHTLLGIGIGIGEDGGGSDRGTIVASVLRAAGDDLARVIDQTHVGGEKWAWRGL